MTVWLRIAVDIAATPARVWQALTVPDEVHRWDGAEPVDVGVGYPAAGQLARWRVPFGLPPRPTRLVPLQDDVQRVEPGTLLQSRISYGFVRVDETYALFPGRAGPQSTRLLTIAGIAADPRPLRPLAVRMTAPAVRAAMQRLRHHCEGAAAVGR